MTEDEVRAAVEELLGQYFISAHTEDDIVSTRDFLIWAVWYKAFSAGRAYEQGRLMTGGEI